MQVKLSTGQVLEADLVISATGVKPNIGFLEHSAVRCLVGVLTDEHLQTNVPGVYAAGDCADPAGTERVSATAASMSAVSPAATSTNGFPVAGLTTVKLSPDAAGHHAPPMKDWVGRVASAARRRQWSAVGSLGSLMTPY